MNLETIIEYLHVFLLNAQAVFNVCVALRYLLAFFEIIFPNLFDKQQN